MVSRSRIWGARRKVLSGRVGLLAIVGLELTTEGIRTGTITERWSERVPNIMGCNVKTASAKWCADKRGGEIGLHPPLSFLQAWCSSCRPTNSVKALKAEEPTTKECKNRKKTKSRKHICSEITVGLNSLRNPCSESRRKRKGCSGKDLQKRKVLSLEWKSEWVMENY